MTEFQNQIMQHVLPSLNIMPEDFNKIEQLSGGMNNHNFKLYTNRGNFFVRFPGAGTSEIVDRKKEYTCNTLAAEIGVDIPLEYFNADNGIKVTSFLEQAETMSIPSLNRKENMMRAIEVFKKLHSCNRKTDVIFSMQNLVEIFEKPLIREEWVFPADYQEIKSAVLELEDHPALGGVSFVPCHNDPWCENWMLDKDVLYLIDWEFSGMNDPVWDLSGLSIECEYTPEQDEQVLTEYFEGQFGENERLRFSIHKIRCDFMWSVWARNRCMNGDDIVDYTNMRYERCKRNLSVF